MTFVTVDIGANWAADFPVLEYLFATCKKYGVNAVKLQCLTDDILARHDELPYYPQASVNKLNVRKINNLAKKYHIEWYATPTAPEHVKLLDKYVNRYKIRAADSDDKDLLDAVFSTGKRVLISSKKPKRFDDSRIKNLYCLSKYPENFEDYNWNLLKKFDGLSTHCLNPLAILKAVMLGAKYVEFHITPSKDYFLLDNHVSYTPEQMIELMRWIRLYEIVEMKVKRSV